jgi:hypothetical protein
VNPWDILGWILVVFVGAFVLAVAYGLVRLALHSLIREWRGRRRLW